MTEDTRQKGSLINLAAFLPVSRSNGPGRRAVVWVQGCKRNCAGCFNQDMRPMEEKQLVDPEELARRILAIDNIEGITFSGGEPFEQAGALADLAKQLKAGGLNLVIFTGYTFDELLTGNNQEGRRLLELADLLVAGPYERDLPAGDYLRASLNQQLVFLTDKLKQHPDVIGTRGQTAEIIVDVSGKVTITGLDEFFE